MSRSCQLAPLSRCGRSACACQGTLPVLVLFLPPALLLFTLFVILPMGEAAWYCLYNWNGYGLPEQVRRLARISRCCAGHPAFMHGARQQFRLIILVSLVIQLPLALVAGDPGLRTAFPAPSSSA